MRQSDRERARKLGVRPGVTLTIDAARSYFGKKRDTKQLTMPGKPSRESALLSGWVK